MIFKKLLAWVLCLVVLCCAFSTPKVHAITNCDVVVIPNIPGAMAEYVFYFSIEKKVEMYDYIKLHFPKDIIFPEQKPTPPGSDIMFDHEQKTIILRSNIALDPLIEGYRDIKLTLPRSLGIKNPPISGIYHFGVSTKNEPKETKSNEVVISRNHTSILECKMIPGSTAVRITEASKPFQRSFAIHPPLLKKNLNSLSALYIPVEHFGEYFNMSFYQNTSSNTEDVLYSWINRSNQRLQFRKNSEGISPPLVNGIEKKWINPPFIFGTTSKGLYVDIHSMMKLFNYPFQSNEDTGYFSYRDPFGLEYLFNRKNLILEVKRINYQYDYDYQLLSPTKQINGDLHIDINFFIFHLWSTMEITKTSIETNEGYKTELVYLGKDENNNNWKVFFSYLAGYEKITLEGVKVFLNDHELEIPKQILECGDYLNPMLDHAQVLVSLNTIVSLMGGNVFHNKLTSEFYATFISKNYSPLNSQQVARHTGNWELEYIANTPIDEPGSTLSIHKLLDTRDVRGAVLFFFASWRGDLDSNLLDMQKVFEDYGKDGIKVFLISIDFKQDSCFQTIKSKVDELKITCPVLWDHESVAKQLNGVELIPAALLIDKEGKIRYEEQAQKSQLNQLNAIPIDSSMLRNAIDFLLDA